MHAGQCRRLARNADGSRGARPSGRTAGPRLDAAADERSSCRPPTRVTWPRSSVSSRSWASTACSAIFRISVAAYRRDGREIDDRGPRPAVPLSEIASAPRTLEERSVASIRGSRWRSRSGPRTADVAVSRSGYDPGMPAGNVTAFFMFDVGDAIDLPQLAGRVDRTVASRLATKPPTPIYLQYQQPPLTFDASALGVGGRERLPRAREGLRLRRAVAGRDAAPAGVLGRSLRGRARLAG